MSPLPSIPGLPGAGCPAAAAALAATGLGTACQVASAASSAVGSAASSVVGFGVDSVLSGIGTWVAQGASWLLAQIGSVIGDTTSVDLGASWFGAHYGTMAELAAVVIVPLLLLGIIQSVYRQNLTSMVRSVLVNVPLAVLLTAVAVKLVQLGLSVTDAMSSAVSHGAGLDSGHFMASVLAGLSGTGAATGQPSAPAFVLFLGALAVVIGAVLVWVELLIRAAAVYVAVLFLPLALASLAWPAIAHWCRRLVDTLVALILGKFVIVSVLSLAAGALAGGTGAADPGGGSFTAVLGGAALLMLSAFAPWAVFRLLPFVEAGAVGHLEGLSHHARHSVSAPIRSLAHTAMQKASVGAVAAAGAAMTGGALGAVLGGGSGGQVGRGAVGSGGPGPSADAEAGGRRAGGGPPDRGPGLGPSSAEATGVGTMEPPGRGVGMYPVHGPATAVANGEGGTVSGMSASVVTGGTVGTVGAVGAVGAGGIEGRARPSSPGSGAVPPGLVPLPRASGTFRGDFLGRDELGIKLIASPQTRPDQSDD